MIKIEEKIELAREIGMEKWVIENEILLEMKAQAEKLTQLNIKPISKEEIIKKISPDCFLNIYTHKIKEKLDFFDTVFSRSVFFLFSNWIKTRYPIGTMNLLDWKENIPYGALLAVKEAKEIGITNFQIHFPITEQRARLMVDPLITGFKGRVVKNVFYTDGVICPINHGRAAYTIKDHYHEEIIRPGEMMEIFSWDDGKIYE